MVKTEITKAKIPPVGEDDSKKNAGSEIIFHGRVRDSEEDEKIIALDYECYQGMAEKKLQALAEESIQKFNIIDLFCTHRIGEIPVGEISLRIVIWSKHRGEGLRALDWFVIELKKQVPIWKWGVTKEGKRFPSTSKYEQ